MEFWLKSPIRVKKHPLLELELLSAERVCEYCPRVRTLVQIRHQWEEESSALFGGHGEHVGQPSEALDRDPICSCAHLSREDSPDWSEEDEEDEFWW